MPHSQPSQRACSVATTSAVWSSEKDCSASGAAAAMKTAAATPRIISLPAPSPLLHQQPRARNHESTKPREVLFFFVFSCFRVFVFSCFRVFVFSCLEHEPQRELHHARIAGEARD